MNICCFFMQVDEAVVKTIINVLTAEEQALGLQQPSGIGQRPRPMSVEYNQTGMSPVLEIILLSLNFPRLETSFGIVLHAL